MSATAVLAELNAAGITVLVQDGKLQLTAGRGTLTPNLLESVKNHKAGLLEILQNCSPSPKGLSAGEALISPNAPGTQVHPIETLTQSSADGESRADIEFARFEKIAVPMAGGGLYCPVHGSPQMPRGIPGKDWDVLLADCRNLGKGVRL